MTPKHIAIIMDGNGRWAKQQSLSRTAGHRAGLQSARKVISCCVEQGVEYLTLFAFSSENWRRPAQEVASLMDLFSNTLKKEIQQLMENGIQLQIIGNKQSLSNNLQNLIAKAEQQTAKNSKLKLQIALNYGGQWDIIQATQRIGQLCAEGLLNPQDISHQLFSQFLATDGIPDPDLFIRTSGELRISNFLLWQLAYSELYFSPVLWPDFNEDQLKVAIREYQTRQRRYGKTEVESHTPELINT